MRAVSAGMGPMAWGYIVMLLLLLSARRFRFPVSYHFYFYFHSPAESFMVARVLFLWLPSWGNTITTHPAGDHKGPPNPSSSTLAPTDVDGLVLRLWRYV